MTQPEPPNPADQPPYPPGQPPYPYGYAAPGPPPDNNMVWGILVTILCCVPFGIVSIVKASEVNTLWAQGHFEAAHQAAESAKKWALWGALSIVGAVVLVFGAFIVAALIGVSMDPPY